MDVGCGDGLLAPKPTGRAARVTGIDSSPEMIARARELAAGHPSRSSTATSRPPACPPAALTSSARCPRCTTKFSRRPWCACASCGGPAGR
ncbi:class I SAM-dependent methyltransferase [Actinomadura sp. NBRC 104425]|uniref:class I SAM-dependent methyltransferase n=1 Tax=Actinomadura sp. NBRC 104425 TaxID=3032204 RepID=UPI00331C639B